MRMYVFIRAETNTNTCECSIVLVVFVYSVHNFCVEFLKTVSNVKISETVKLIIKNTCYSDIY